MFDRSQGIVVGNITRVKAPRRLSGRQNSPKYYLPTENTAPTLPLLFTLEEATLELLLTSAVSTAVAVVTLPRLYRLLRTLWDFFSARGVVVTRSLGTGADVIDKSNLGEPESGNRDVR